ncbi:MAG: F0F1 ATP synthase subunit A [Methanothrix sp.]|jgi:F-type H+-transporting ATPase subunit a|nr:F0F1 ATP synthase subunit A [Methanothrix sp.]HON35965.1 F0F1 ATP synthase subunit A [Methanothrix sp.]HPW72624.1 F0F1 ATP synthase subunit A [Methanothrix sp.]HRU75273.1 F0F1 ATP synthase subunit A [Methanothrix sp.]
MVELSPDEVVFWQMGFVSINETILFTWVVMAILLLLGWLSTRHLSPEPPFSRSQNLLEILLGYMQSQIKEIAQMDPDRYLPFSGTLFLFISLANLLDVVPGYRTPTSSISTTAALAICVFFAVPIYGVAQSGIRGYLKHYAQPTILMLPFHIIGELSRTLALAVRLFGNMMSESMLMAILLTIAPLFLPVLLDLLGLLIGQVQAYIFAVLATVYIVSASSAQESTAMRLKIKS